MDVGDIKMIEISKEFLKALLVGIAAIEDPIERESMLEIIVEQLGL